jgi:hypothetical protein
MHASGVFLESIRSAELTGSVRRDGAMQMVATIGMPRLVGPESRRGSIACHPMRVEVRPAGSSSAEVANLRATGLVRLRGSKAAQVGVELAVLRVFRTLAFLPASPLAIGYRLRTELDRRRACNWSRHPRSSV